MKQRSQDVGALEVVRAAGEVHEPCGIEAAFFVEHEADAPVPASYRLVAMAAFGLAGRSALGAADPGQAPVGRVAACRALESIRIGRALARLLEGLEHRLGPLVGAAQRMEPEGRLTLRERVGNALAEAHFSLLDGPPTAAALGATGRGRLEGVGHQRRTSSTFSS